MSLLPCASIISCRFFESFAITKNYGVHVWVSVLKNVFPYFHHTFENDVSATILKVIFFKLCKEKRRTETRNDENDRSIS